MSTVPQRKVTGSLGCFGVFCIFCLLTFTVAEVGALWWLNPDWLDRNAFWRGKILPPDDVDTSGGMHRYRKFRDRLPKI